MGFADVVVFEVVHNSHFLLRLLVLVNRLFVRLAQPRQDSFGMLVDLNQFLVHSVDAIVLL